MVDYTEAIHKRACETSEIVDRRVSVDRKMRDNCFFIPAVAPTTFKNRSFWLILRRWKLVRIGSSRAGGAQEYLAAVSEGDIPRIRPFFGMIARLVAVNDDFESRRKSGLVDPAAKQCVGASALKHPDFLCAVRLGHFDMDPGMGIDPFYFYDLAPDQNRGIGIEFGSKRVMRCCRLRSHQ